MSRIADPNAKRTLLGAAEEVFSERGVAGAKVEDIAKRAGVSKGAFYLHFESKEAALREIIEAWLERCAANFASPADYPAAPFDADAMLDFCIERDIKIYSFIWETRLTMRILRTCRGDYEYLFQAFRSDMQRRSRAWLEQWKADGLMRPEVDVRLAALLISGAHEELSVQLVSSERRPDFEDWLDFTQATFVRAFGTREFIDALERRHRRASMGALRVQIPPRSSSSFRAADPVD